MLKQDIEHIIKDLPGPIAIFGAGGFIGINLFLAILKVRSDVVGISQDHQNNWRFMANKIPAENLSSVDILQQIPTRHFFEKHKPKTIFNLSAYGAYSKQKEYDKIYQTNFVASIDIIEIAKEFGFHSFVQAGSSSEYGLNSAAPSEDSNLIPNSHYAVSKTAIYQAIKYYGFIEKLPIAQLRLYSVYGPWEEPDRLIPVLISNALKLKYPPLVNPLISRDFIYITDVVNAFILSANNINNIKGLAINIGTGIKTTIADLAQKVEKIYSIPNKPNFNTMANRNWDTEDWFGNVKLASEKLNWHPEIALEQGLKKIGEWQKEINFDNAFWNYNK